MGGGIEKEKVEEGTATDIGQPSSPVAGEFSGTAGSITSKVEMDAPTWAACKS